MSSILMYSPSDVKREHGAINITRYCKSCNVKEILNGNFIAEIELVFNPILWDEVKRESVMYINTHRGYLTFRVKHLNKNDKTMKLNCRHLFWDFQNNLIEDIFIKAMTGDQAIKYIMGHGQYEDSKLWTAKSDILDVRNCRIVREYKFDAFVGSDPNSFINRWGGELTVNDFSISIDKQRGLNLPPIKIKWGKNIKGFVFYEDYSTICTRAMPIGFDGLMLPEKYIDSPLIKEYANVYIKKIKFEDIKLVKEGDNSEPGDGAYASADEAYREMRRRVNEDVYGKKHMDQPSQNIRADMISLRESDQYSKYNFNELESVQLGQLVEVDINEYNVVSTKRCISIQYDSLRDRYIEVELGDFKEFQTTQTVQVSSAIDSTIDSKLENYKSGMFFHRNDDDLTIDSTPKEVCFMTFGTSQNTHLQSTICIIFKANSPGLAKMTISIDNNNLDVIPMQTYTQGYFTWTITVPLLFMEANKAHYLSIKMDSTTNTTIKKDQLYVTIYGQSVTGGMGADYPHAEIVEKVSPKLIQHFSPVLPSDSQYVELINNTTGNVSEKVIPEFSIPVFATDSFNVVLTKYGFQTYWEPNQYTFNPNYYKMTTDGVSVVVDKLELGFTPVVKEDYVYGKVQLPSTDKYSIIDNIKEE